MRSTGNSGIPAKIKSKDPGSGVKARLRDYVCLHVLDDVIVHD